MKSLILFILKAYHKAFGVFYPRCRFYPSCSCYTYEAVERHGIIKGIFLGVKRLLRCHPFNAGGHDPVP